jgi:hypothetical protein
MISREGTLLFTLLHSCLLPAATILLWALGFLLGLTAGDLELLTAWAWVSGRC